MLGFLRQIWNEVYGNKKPAQPQIAPTYEKPLDDANVKEQIKEAPIISKTVIAPLTPVSEADYRKILGGIDDVSEFNHQYQRCPEHLKYLFGSYMQKMVDELDEIGDVEDAYSRANFAELEELLIGRYRKLLTLHLKDAEMEDLETRYNGCPDLEIFGEEIKKYYRKLLNELDSIDDLEERHSNCPEDFNDLFREPYQRLLHEVDLIEDLEAHFGNCPEEVEEFFLLPYNNLLGQIESVEDLQEYYNNARDYFESLFDWHYRRLLEKEDSLSDLESFYSNCSECFNGLIFARYRDLLQGITSIEELDERLEECDESFNSLIVARCFDVLPLAMKKLSKDEMNEFCENLRDEFKPLGLVLRDQLLEKTRLQTENAQQ